jgi:pimeloyl-ACP methyl ester carboxylesterase
MKFMHTPDGTRIAYQRCGDGPPLVLVHGSADDHSMWTGLLPALGARFTVYALDRRGRGASSATNGASYAIEHECADVAAVVDAVGEPAHLLGHSYGALCALEAALRTRNLRSLVLYEPPIPTPPGSVICPPDTLAKMATLLEAGDREETVLTFAREIAHLPEAEISAARSTPEWQTSVAAAHTIVYEARAVEGYTFDPERFRELTTPTLLLLGSESPPFLKAATESVAAALQNNRLVELPNQGHLAMYTNPQLFLSEVTQFLSDT